MKIKLKQYIPQIVAILSFASLCIIALIIDEQGGKYGVGIKKGIIKSAEKALAWQNQHCKNSRMRIHVLHDFSYARTTSQ